MGAGPLGSGLNSKLSLAAMEMDVEIGGDDVATMFVEIGEGSFTSMTVTKLVGVSERVGDETDFVSSPDGLMPLISALRKCDVNSSIH